MAQYKPTINLRKIKENQFEAAYDYYLTGIPEPGKAVVPFITRCLDVCILAQKEGNWIIVDIEQVSETSIPLV